MKTLTIVLFVFVTAAFSYWENSTNTFGLTRISVVNTHGRENVFAQVPAGTQIGFPVKRRTSVKWKISADSSAVFRVYTSIQGKDTVISSQTLTKGTHDVRLFCEPGRYWIVSSAPIRAQYFIWRELDLTPIVPAGGGFPVNLLAKDNTTTQYFYIAKDSATALKIVGPATAYVYVRAYVPVGSGMQSLVFEVQKEGTVIAHKLIQASPSAEAAFASPIVGYLPSKASLVKVNVPAGVHQYTVKSLNDRALVRFFSKKKAARASRTSHIPVMGKTGAVLEDSAALAKVSSSKKKELAVSFGSGILAGSNVYTYGEDKIDGFPPDTNTQYRYPGVSSLGDVFFPLDLKLMYQYGHMRVKGAFGTEIYGHNRQLNDADFQLALGYAGPVSVEFAYLCGPRNAVRPTYVSAGSYSLLEYISHRADISMRVANPWHPGVTFSYGVYDYSSNFEYLNAVYFEGEAGIARTRICGKLNENAIRWRTSLCIGDIMAVKEAELDRSNAYVAFRAGINFDVRQWTFGLGGELNPRFYSTSSDSDGNKGRRDFEYSFTPLIQYHHGGMTATLHFLDIDGRNVDAADIQDETSKSYVTFGAGLKVSVIARPLNWMRIERD